MEAILPTNTPQAWKLARRLVQQTQSVSLRLLLVEMELALVT